MAIERQHRPIDKEFEEADYTGVLDISGRKLRLFPNIGDDIYDSLEVFTAIIAGNRFDKLPSQIFKYQNLVKLNFHNNCLRTIPKEIAQLKELKELNLSRNYLQHLPSSICTMDLHLFSVSNNRLTDLPKEIGQMRTLKSLDVSCNNLVYLPPSFTDLSALVYLNIHRNEIKELPSDIIKVPLSHLNVSSNMLTRLPISLRHMNSLSVFHCENNPLEWPPAQICMRGINHVFKYLAEMEKYGSDPQLFATNRDESLMRRRNNRSKKVSRPTSDASTLSGNGSDYSERSLIDEMTNFVQSAFGGHDARLFQRNESDPSGGRLWTTQYSAYEERSPYRHIRAMREDHQYKGRYRSQSPGPTGVPTQQPVSSQSGTHYGTLPRTSKDNDGNPDDIHVQGRAAPRHVTSNRISSPILSDRAPRSHSSEPYRDPDQAYYGDEKTPPAKHHTEFSPPRGSSTPDRSVHSHGEEVLDPSPPSSREGSVTPTPDDLDMEEPSTPREKPSYSKPTLDQLTKVLSDSTLDSQTLVKCLNIQDTSSDSIEDIVKQWFTENPTGTWDSIIPGLRAAGLLDIADELESQYKLTSFTMNQTDLNPDTSGNSDINKTPQHEVSKQVSFSVEISEIPDRLPSASSEEDTQSDTYIEHEDSLSPTSLEGHSNDVVLEEGEEPTSPTVEPMSPTEEPMSPTNSGNKPLGPKPPPKPRSKENTTWPRPHRSPHKRKDDVFKVIGKQDPNFTVRRQIANMQQELEKIQNVKKEMEDLLGVSLADDLGESISDGVLLCKLVNMLHPNTIATIHIPRDGETLSIPKQTMNVAAFIAACKKLGVPEAIVCSAGEILEFKDPVRVSGCIQGLLDTISV